MILELVQNIAFLVALAVGLQVLAHRWEKGSFVYRLAAGFLFGIVGIAGMMTPVHFQPGVIYDGRSIVLSLAGLFGGPVVAAVAAVLCSAFRIYLGGAGVTAGVSVVITSATLGTFLFYLRKQSEQWVSPWRLLAFGVFVHLLMLLSQVLFLPGEAGLEVVRRIGLGVLVFYPLGFLVIARVFLEGEQREEATRSLKESQERYRQLSENTEAIPWEYDIRQDQWTYVAPQVEQILGYAPKEWTDFEFWKNHIHEEDRQWASIYCAECTERGEAHDFEYRFHKKDGPVVWLRDVVHVEMDNGFPVKLRGFMLEITRQKKTEIALVSSEQRFRSLFENAPVGVFRTSSKGQALSVNSTMAAILDCESPDEAVQHYTNLASQLYVHPEQREEFLNTLLQQGQVKGFEYEAETSTGRIIWLSMNARIAERNEDGSLVIEGFATDITQRKLAEQALAEATLRLKEAVKAGNVGLWDWDVKTNEVYYSPEWKAQIGYEDHEIGNTFQEWESRVHPEDLKPTLDRILAYLDGKKSSYQVEFRFRHKNGHYLWILAQASILRDEKGQAVRTLGSHVDITERKEVEKALQESERRIRTLMDNLPGVAYRCENSKDWKMEFVSSVVTELTGYEADEITSDNGINYGDIIHPDDRDWVWKTVEAALDDKQPFTLTYRINTRDGQEKWVWEQGRGVFGPDGEIEALEGFISDITQRKKAEEELRQSGETMSALLNASSDAAFMMDREGTVLAFNEELARRIKTPPENLKGMNLYKLLPADVATGRKERVDHVIASGEPVRFVDERQGRIIDNSIYPLFDSHGQVTQVAVFGRDITEQRKAESERERLIAAIEQAAEIILITDPEGTIEYVNPAFEKVTGYSREEAVGRNPRILKSGEHDRSFYQNLWQTIIRGETWEGRMVNKRKDGSLYTEDATLSAVRDGAGQIIHYVGVKRDITQFLELEKQYQQSQKMESIGQLAGGVAHDFNNLLQVINGGTSMAMEDLEPEHPAVDILEEVAKAGERAAILVGQLLAFSRRQIMRPENLDLNEVVAGLLKMLGRVIGEHIRLEFVRGHEIGMINADRGMIEQVLMNLCVNARDAMPEGGSLTIETRNAYLNEGFCRAHPAVQAGRYAMLQITDTGFGMDEETLEKVFEPFFTTKEPGKGTGLGLATVYGIIQQHDGIVIPQSEPGRGTTFEIYLPIHERAEQEEEAEEAEPFLGGTETILLAEDDESVRLVSKNILERAGYTVLTANDGREAVEVFCQKADKIALALLDVVMPELGGREAYERMEALRPDLKALFASGYSEDSIHSNYILEEGVSLLQKPYAPNTLLKRVREILDA